MEIYEFTIIVSTNNDWHDAMVQIGHDPDTPAIAWMTACEYLINSFAKMSKLPYDEAVKALKQGANEYTDVMTV